MSQTRSWLLVSSTVCAALLFRCSGQSGGGGGSMDVGSDAGSRRPDASDATAIDAQSADALAPDALLPDAQPSDAHGLDGALPPTAICVADDFERVSIFDAAASGDTAPRQWFGSVTELLAPQQIALDAARGELYVRNSLDYVVRVYARTENGNVAPIRSIDTATSALSFRTLPIAIALDTQHDELFVLRSSGAITVHPRASSGQSPPIRTLAPSPYGTMPLSGFSPAYTSLAIDPVHDEILLLHGDQPSSVEAVPRSGSGVVSPTRTLMLPAGNATAQVLALDSVHDEIIVSTKDFSVASQSVLVFPRNASGSAAPTRVFSGAFLPGDVFVDAAHDEILLADGSQVDVVSRTATGSVSPLRSLMGSFFTGAVTVDAANDELWIGDVKNDALLAYPRSARDMNPPVRSIDASRTRLSQPIAIAADSEHGEIFVSTSTGVFAFSASAMGPAVTPVRTIVAGLTSALAYDGAHDAIVILDGSPFCTSVSRVRTGTDTPRSFRLGMWNGDAVVADAIHEELLVHATAFTPSGMKSRILVFSTDGSSDEPTRTIDESSPSGESATGMGYDPARDEVWVLTSDQLRVYPRAANGATPPLRALDLSGGLLVGHMGLAIGASSMLFVGTGSGISIYDGAHPGAPVLLQSIGGPATMLERPVALTACR